MFYKLFNILGCSKIPKQEKNQKCNNIPSLPSLDDDRLAENIKDSEPSLLKNLEIYAHSKPGSGPGKTECQDSYIVLQQLTPKLNFFAIYDGHGIKGKDVSQFVNKHFAKCLTKNAQKIEKLIEADQATALFQRCFAAIDQKLIHSGINIANSGSCCVNTIIYKDKCFVANLGDSRAILCRGGLDGKDTVIELSQDHKPTREDEKKRILQKGGFVEPMYYRGVATGPLRVWTKEKEAGIAMTRVMGDARGKRAGLISEPEVLKIDLQPNDKFIIVASDGLWDAMSSEEAASFVSAYLAKNKPKSQVAKALTAEARERWSKFEDNQEYPYFDDITIVVAFPSFEVEETQVGSLTHAVL